MKKIVATWLMVFLAVIGLAACGGHQGARPKNEKIGLHQPALPLSSTPSVLMYDSVTVGSVPAGATHIACYASGRYANCAAMRQRFPHATLVSIATWDGVVAKCLDTEPGDAVPSQDPGWVRAMLARGVYRPCIYADAFEMQSVRSYMAASGIPRSEYLLWDADWTSRYGVDAGYDATQYFSNCCIDKSAVATYFFASRPKPKPVPAVLVLCFGKRRGLSTCKRMWAKAAASSETAYKNQGCPVLAQRVSWFSSRLKKHPHVKAKRRKAALAASRRAYKQRGCAVYAQRVKYFQMKEAKA